VETAVFGARVDVVGAARDLVRQKPPCSSSQDAAANGGGFELVERPRQSESVRAMRRRTGSQANFDLSLRTQGDGYTLPYGDDFEPSLARIMGHFVPS